MRVRHRGVHPVAALPGVSAGGASPFHPYPTAGPPAASGVSGAAVVASWSRCSILCMATPGQSNVLRGQRYVRRRPQAAEQTGSASRDCRLQQLSGPRGAVQDADRASVGMVVAGGGTRACSGTGACSPGCRVRGGQLADPLLPEVTVRADIYAVVARDGSVDAAAAVRRGSAEPGCAAAHLREAVHRARGRHAEERGEREHDGRSAEGGEREEEDAFSLHRAEWGGSRCCGRRGGTGSALAAARTLGVRCGACVVQRKRGCGPHESARCGAGVARGCRGHAPARAGREWRGCEDGGCCSPYCMGRA